MAEEAGEAGATPAEAPTPEEGATPAGQSTEGAKPEDGEDTGKLRDAGKAALEREREARREAERRATEAERQLQSLQDEGKTELERAVARADRAAAELEQERANRSRLEEQVAAGELLELKRSIASEMGVPQDAAHRLEGTDVRTLKADATRYLEERKQVEGDLGLGRGGAAAGRSGADMNSIIREAAGRRS